MVNIPKPEDVMPATDANTPQEARCNCAICRLGRRPAFIVGLMMVAVTMKARIVAGGESEESVQRDIADICSKKGLPSAVADAFSRIALALAVKEGRVELADAETLLTHYES